MTDIAITTGGIREGRQGTGLLYLEFYQLAAITAVTLKEWIVPHAGRIVDVVCDSEVANSGEASDIIDVHKNGTTIYTTQANRPTLPVNDTGLFTEAGEPEITTVRAGDVLLMACDQIATTGSQQFKGLIIIKPL